MSSILWIYILLIAFGAFGALVFVADYSRTADLKQPIARQLLVLNFAMGLLLFLILIRYIFAIDSNILGYRIVTFTLLAIIDLAIFYQWRIMRNTRKKSGRRFTDAEKV